MERPHRSALPMRHLLIAAVLATCSTLSAGQDLFDPNVIRDFHLQFSQPNWWNLILNTPTTGVPVLGELTVDGITYEDVGLRIKGASSASVPGDKKPFNLEMDAVIDDQNLYGYETLNLNNGAVDPTLTREVISYRILRNYLPAPNASYARLHLNGTYWGIYVMVEQPNKRFLRDWFRSDEGTRYKADNPNGTQVGSSSLQWFGSTPADYATQYEIKTPNHPDAWTDLIDFLDILNNTDPQDFASEITEVLNVDRALWYQAAMNAIINSDDYTGARHNYYMYFDPDDGRMNMIPWDLNEAFGVHGPSTNPWTYDIEKSFSATNTPLVNLLMGVPKWRELYYAHYRTILEEWIDWNDHIGPLNSELQTLIAADVASDSNYLYPTYFAPSFPGKTFLSFHFVHGLLEVVTSRAAYLLTQSDLTKPEPQIDDVALLTPNPLEGSSIGVTARVTAEAGAPPIASVQLRWSALTAFAAVEMFDDGAHSDGAAGDGVFGGSFPAGSLGAEMRYYISATDLDGTVQVDPPRAEFEFYSVDVDPGEPTGVVRINEFVAKNDSGATDELGAFEDWVELYNSSQSVVDLSGMYLTDDLALATQWPIPAGTTLGAEETLLVWADNDLSDGPLHAPFKLSASGEVVALFESDGTTLADIVQFGPQLADVSTGRFLDGSPLWVTLPAPTPGTSNSEPGACGVRHYDQLQPLVHTLNLSASGSTAPNSTLDLTFSGAPPGSTYVLLWGTAPSAVEYLDTGLLLLNSLNLQLLPFSSDATGSLALQIPLPAAPGLAGLKLYLQTGSVAPQLAMSNGLELTFCP